jgi:hypothetical protein
MQLMERVRRGEFLGREFLVWLWFRSETREGMFDLGEEGTAELRIDRRIVLQGEGDEGAEKVTCTGENPHLREARFALTEHKEITEAMIRLVLGDNEWSFILDSVWMNFKSFKTPKVFQDKGEDPEGIFYEKMFLINQAVSAIETIYSQFINMRVSPDWESRELPALRKWINQGK